MGEYDTVSAAIVCAISWLSAAQDSIQKREIDNAETCLFVSTEHVNIARQRMAEASGQQESIFDAEVVQHGPG